jgi:H/ACA ribonucleoprotein complex subunit 2
MGKTKDPEEKKLKKEKKEKRKSVDGVTKVKKDKKEKKSKTDIADALEVELEKSPEVSLVRIDAGGDVIMNGEDAVVELRGALVPFAFPLAESEKDVKKILKTVKKCEFFAL